MRGSGRQARFHRKSAHPWRRPRRRWEAQSLAPSDASARCEPGRPQAARGSESGASSCPVISRCNRAASHGHGRAGQCDVSSGAHFMPCHTIPSLREPLAVQRRRAAPRHWQPPGGCKFPERLLSGPPTPYQRQHGGLAPRCALHNTQRTLRGDIASSIGAASARRMPSSISVGGRGTRRACSKAASDLATHVSVLDSPSCYLLDAVQAPNVLGTVSSGREASRRVACGRSNLGYNTRHPPHAAPSPTTRTCALDGLLTRLSWGVRGQRKQLHVVRASTARHKQIDDMRLRLCESRWGGRQACPSAISSSKSETVSPPCGGMLIASWADGRVARFRYDSDHDIALSMRRCGCVVTKSHCSSPAPGARQSARTVSIPLVGRSVGASGINENSLPHCMFRHVSVL
jgi:hypothetical protein